MTRALPALASVIMLTGCGVDCLHTTRRTSYLTIPDSAQVVACINDNRHSMTTAVIQLNEADFAVARAEALDKGYQPLKAADIDNIGYPQTKQFFLSSGLFRYEAEGNNSVKFALLEDSLHRVIAVRVSNF